MEVQRDFTDLAGRFLSCGALLAAGLFARNVLSPFVAVPATRWPPFPEDVQIARREGIRGRSPGDFHSVPEVAGFVARETCVSQRGGLWADESGREK